MKSKRTHRRKLRFNPAKDASHVVTVKVDHTPKRRKRQNQHRARHASPAPAGRPSSTAHPTSGLSATVWSSLQEHFTAARSLGELTTIMLQFFKEHENLRSAPRPVFPIFVPSSDIYQMKVPRKRRIYDVLHVLEGIGVIKRVRYDESRKTKGGYFLYYGKPGVVERLAKMKSDTAQVLIDFFRSCGPRVPSLVEEDSALVKFFENQAADEKWPCLVTTTVSFLGILFQQDYQVGIALPIASERLVEAKKFLGAPVSPSSWNDTSFHDVQRRVYDVASVLTSCNLIFTSATPNTSVEPSLESIDKNASRKLARFNYNIFTDPKELFSTRSASQESVCESPGAVLCAFPSPTQKALKDLLVSPPSAYWRSLPDSVDLATSPVVSPVAARVLDTDNCGERTTSAGRDNVANARILPVRAQSQTPPISQAREFFSPLGRTPMEKNEWYDESVGQLELHDDFPVEHKIDWKRNMECKDSSWSTWGSQNPAAAVSFESVGILPHQFQVDSVEVKMEDIGCHEPLDGSIANFFC